MGYLDNQIGYPNDILASRAIIKKIIMPSFHLTGLFVISFPVLLTVI